MLLDPKQPVRFTPADQAGRPEETRVVYLLKVPRLYDGAALDRAVAARGGRNHGALARLRSLRAGVKALLADDDEAVARDNLVARIDAYADELRAFGRALLAGEYDAAGETEESTGPAKLAAALAAQAEHEAALAEVAELVREGYPLFARMVADEAVYPDILGIEAARLLLVGWENGPGEFRRGRAGVPDEVLEAIPPYHLVAIGAEVERLRRPSEAQRKNSASPSRSPAAPATSTAASAPLPTSPS